MTKDLKFSSLFFITGIGISIFCEKFSMTFFLFVLLQFLFKQKVLRCSNMITAHCGVLRNSICQFVYARAERRGGKWNLYDKLL